MKKRKVKIDVDFEGVFRGRKTSVMYSNKYLHKLADANRPKRSRKERPPEAKTRRSRAEVREDREL